MSRYRTNRKRRHSRTSEYSRDRNSRDSSGSREERSERDDRYSKKDSYNKGRGDSRSRRSNNPSHWKSKNRRVRRSTIDHSKYICKAEDASKSKYIPENSFYDFNLDKTLLDNILNRNYINPTKIQDQAIPLISKGKDILGIASTGSGKTGAFLIPMCNKALKNKDQRTLIVTPTRELATQINNEFRQFTDNTPLRMVIVIGGANIRTQIQKLRRGPQFVVATPGRLLDLVKKDCIDLKSFNNIILDEVDQMLDMGFVHDIKKIVSELNENRQSLFFSATMTSREEAIANTLLDDPIKVQVNKTSALNTIEQDIVRVHSRKNKLETLHSLLRSDEFNKVLVFSATKREADYISYELRQKGIAIESLHGDKPQSKRSRILKSFRKDEIDVLVATDVAARGIDIPDISHVINYDEPATYNDYVHRIGRTGRIGKKGTALTFVKS